MRILFVSVFISPPQAYTFYIKYDIFSIISELLSQRQMITMLIIYPTCFFVCRQVLHNLVSPDGGDVRHVTTPRHVACI